jgi:hypothetical protein
MMMNPDTPNLAHAKSEAAKPDFTHETLAPEDRDFLCLAFALLADEEKKKKNSRRKKS